MLLLRFKLGDVIITNFITCLFVLICFSYPTTIVLILSLGLPPNIINIVLKLLLLLLSIVVIIYAFRTRQTRVPKVTIPTLVFLFIYSFRLIYDVSIRGIDMLAYNRFYIYSYFFGVAFLPTIALILSHKLINVKHIIKYAFVLLISGNVLLFYHLLYNSKLSFIQMLAGRSQVVDVEKGDNFTFINPITVGLFGASLVLFAICYKLDLNYSKFKINVVRFFLLLLGAANMLIGASRGPILSLMLVLVLLLLVYFKDVLFRSLYSFWGFIVKLALSLFLFYYVISFFVEKNEIFVLQRIFSFYDKVNSGGKEYRDYAFESAINDFLSSPIIGKQFVGTYDNFYPHNLPIEILMSLGLIGGVVFVLIVLYQFRSVKYIFAHKCEYYKMPILTLALMSILQSQTSGTIIANPEYWLLTTLLILLPLLHENRTNVIAK